MPELGSLQQLPPLNALRVFHMVVQHRSFRAAADELRVSPQAVSQQIKLLEGILKVPLFERRGRSIELTEQAVQLSHFVQAGFDELAEGIRQVTRNAPRKRINLNVSPYFATRYLLDCMHRFNAIVPGVDLRLTTMVNLPDFARDDVDVAIQWGFGNWGQFDQVLLMQDRKILCCTPALASDIASPRDLLTKRLLHPVLAGGLWRTVLASLGLDEEPAVGDPRFQDAATLRRATLAGLGVGLLSEADALEDLRAGRLVAPLGENVMAAMPPEQIPAFYLVLPRSHRRVKTIDLFCRWVEGEDWQGSPGDIA